MPSDAGKSVLLRMLEMFATGEVDAASDTIAADYREHDRGRTTRPHGVAGFCETVRAARSEFVDLDVWPRSAHRRAGPGDRPVALAGRTAERGHA